MATRSLLSVVLLSHRGLRQESKVDPDKECGLSNQPPSFESGVSSTVALANCRRLSHQLLIPNLFVTPASV